mmetsp:Transcript_50472/g.127206  ORF Transcript_50472/g.127206 Transcript_50472/m.127206 type:complete len:160 (-) Transcript_50472:205-684(-)
MAARRGRPLAFQKSIARSTVFAVALFSIALLAPSLSWLVVPPTGRCANAPVSIAPAQGWKVNHGSTMGLHASRGPAAAAAAAVVAAALAGGVSLRAAGCGSRLQGMLVRRRFFFGGDEKKPAGAGGTIYDFTVQDIESREVSLKDFEGKVVLIVNVASK